MSNKALDNLLDQLEDLDNIAITFMEDNMDVTLDNAVDHACYQQQIALDDTMSSEFKHELRFEFIIAHLKLCDANQLSKIQNLTFDLINGGKV